MTRWLVGLTEYAGLTSYTGGIGRHYSSLLPALVRKGVDVDLALYTPDSLISDKAEGGVNLVARRRLARTPPAAVPLIRALDFRVIASAFSYDAIFLPEWGGLGAFLPRSAPMVTNLATSMRISNDISGVDVTRLPRSRRRVIASQNWVEDRQIRRSRGLIPISTAMQRRNEHLLGELPPAVVVRNCIDVAETVTKAETAPLPVGWPTAEGPVVLFLGRLERRKGVTDAAQAFGILDDPTARLVFAGASGDSRFEPTRQELLGLMPERMRGRVTFLDHVGGDELFRGIRDASVVVCPSRWEGFGQVALEAKAIGTPLIVTTMSGYDDYCTDGVDSLMTPPQDPAALAEAIRRILNSPSLAAAIAAAATNGMPRFTADSVAPDIITAVNRLLTSESTGPTRGGGD